MLRRRISFLFKNIIKIKVLRILLITLRLTTYINELRRRAIDSIIS